MSRESCVTATEKRYWLSTAVSFVVSGHDLQPEEVTALLGIEPTGTRSPGPSRWSRPGDTDGLWGIRCDSNLTHDFREQLAHVLSIMESKKDELTRLVGRGYDVTVDFYGFAGNDCVLTLRPDEVERIAALGFPLKVAANMNER
ncbi:DUF4279 domain-containing protein [Streptomyces sp. NPDC058459]|uniref:DUF4279 domain-containing protein n=1 Tax=Streptomyces sp. NPDC058459 TaxID=3346508 RepID=UPI003654BAB7